MPPTLRSAPPLAGTTAMSDRFPSSTAPVGFHTNAMLLLSGDQRGSATMYAPDVMRRCWPVARSITHRWLYCAISSSTTWSHFFLRQSLTCLDSVSSMVNAMLLPSGDHRNSPTDSAKVASFVGSPPCRGISQMLGLPSSLPRGDRNASVSPPGENCGA